MTPSGSPFYEQNSKIIQELERDITEFKGKCYVLVIGDFNSRIDNLLSITSEDKTYHRDNIDAEDNHNGRELMKLMNGTGMVILSGIRKKTKFTCIKEMKNKMRKSVVDHICIDEGVMNIIVEEETKEDIMEVIKTDHAMVAISIKIRIIEMKEEKTKLIKINDKREEKPKPLSKITNKKVWLQYEKECEENKQLKEFAENLDFERISKSTGVERKWEEFKNTIVTLEDWVRKMDKELGDKQFTYLNQMIKSSEEIIKILRSKKIAWRNYKKSKGTNKEPAKWRYFKWIRNRTKKLIKKKIGRS